MNAKLLPLLLFFGLAFSFNLSAQLRLKLQLMPNGESWGVYVKIDSTYNPSPSTTTASGQVTVVVPNGYQFDSIENVAGKWINNATIIGPPENPGMTYRSIGLQQDQPHIDYVQGQETLLFIFHASSGCPTNLYLIENDDPFAQLPNSASSNPGNDLAAVDTGNGVDFYFYSGNYAPFAWDCHDCDNDGIPNALEDTNGDGQYTPGVDVSDLCGGSECTAPVFTQQPANAATCSGEQSAFATSLTNQAGLSFQWQFSADGGSTWISLSDNSIYAGTKTKDLTIQNTAGLNNFQYRLIAAESTCETISDPATLMVDGPVSIISQPENVDACAGSSAAFAVSVENGSIGSNIHYQWMRACSANVWEDLEDGGPNGISGAQTAQLEIADISGMGNCIYRVKYFTDLCDGGFSASAELTETAQVSFTDQPQAASTCDGDMACFHASVGNAGASYQWQTSTDGVNWENVSNSPVYNGSNMENLCISNVAGLDGRCYRLEAQTDCGTAFSEKACLTITDQTTIVQQPVNDTVCINEGGVFTVAIDAGDFSNVSYQWQILTNTWEDLADNFVFSGTQTNTLTVGSANISPVFKFRVKVTTGCGEIFSNQAALYASQEPVISVQPKDVAVCGNGNATLFTGVSYSGVYPLSFQWQQSLDNGATWTDLAEGQSGANTYQGTKDVTLHISPSTTLNGSLYRMLTWNAGCGVYESASAKLSLEGPISFLSNPADARECHNGSTMFAASVGNSGAGTIQYQWEVFGANNTWTPIQGNSIYGGATTNNLFINPVAGLYDNKYRVKARTGACDWITGSAAQLTVEGPLVFELQPDDASVCPDSSHNFGAEVVNLGAGSMQLQWQMSSNGGNTWNNIGQNQSTANGGTYTGVPTGNLNVSQTAGLDGYQYRLKATTAECEAYSDVAVLNADESLCPPPPISVCMKMKLQYMPYLQGWGVFVRPDEDSYLPVFNQATSGRVTIVAPQGFNYSYLTSHAGGDWQPETTYMSLPGYPGMMSITFKLKPNLNQLLLQPGEETMLFSFRKFDGCPDDLFILEQAVPNGPPANLFTGVGLGLGFGPDVAFGFCDVYDREAWKCTPAYYLLGNSNNNLVASTAEWFEVSPNPAKDWVSVDFRQEMEKTAKVSLQIWSLQGSQLRSEQVTDFGKMRLSLDGLPKGTYFLALDVDGKVMQRQRIIKH